MLSFGMTILIFLIIVMYGTWIAMSVVEEKSSRVMEVVLNAASPFELLAGKVLGVGAVAFTQYAALVAAGGVAVLLRARSPTRFSGGRVGDRASRGPTIRACCSSAASMACSAS